MSSGHYAMGQAQSLGVQTTHTNTLKDQNNFLWMATSVPLRPYFQKYLPKFVFDRLSLCIYGFEFHEKLRPFQEYAGPQGDDKSYFLVTCGRAEFWTRDAEICAAVLNRPRDFVQFELTELFVCACAIICTKPMLIRDTDG